MKIICNDSKLVIEKYRDGGAGSSLFVNGVERFRGSVITCQREARNYTLIPRLHWTDEAGNPISTHPRIVPRPAKDVFGEPAAVPKADDDEGDDDHDSAEPPANLADIDDGDTVLMPDIPNNGKQVVVLVFDLGNENQRAIYSSLREHVAYRHIKGGMAGLCMGLVRKGLGDILNKLARASSGR